MLWWPGAPKAVAARLALTLGLACLPSAALLHAQVPPPVPRVAVNLLPEHEHYRPRVEAALSAALERYEQWLGPYPAPLVRVDSAAWRTAGTDVPGRVTLRLPWRSAPPTMDVESAAALGLARSWWPAQLAAGEARPIIEGIAWYLQSRVVEDLFDLTFQQPGHSAEGLRLFGGILPWSLPALTRSRWTGGLLRHEFLRDAGAATPRGALALGTLERLVGAPALETALRALARRAASETMTRADVEQTLSAAAGRPLSWLLASVVETAARHDYALGDVSTSGGPDACSGAACYRTRVEVMRRGEAVFSGTDRAPVGPFESGDAIALRVVFSDGQAVPVTWDGRAASRTFEFDSPAPPASVILDPDGVLLLDVNYLDNTRRLHPVTDVPVRKWVAWWMLWLQEATLSYAFLL
jgi:hypothetical protein